MICKEGPLHITLRQRTAHPLLLHPRSGPSECVFEVYLSRISQPTSHPHTMTVRELQQRV